MNNKPDPDTTCPYTGHKALCRSHYMNCPKWIQVVGVNPNDGMQVNEWACADTWMPILMIENSQQQRQTAAAVESFRNDLVRGMQQVVPPKADPKLVKATGD